MIELIPAIDLIDGRCVRLTQGDYQQRTVYDIPPVDMVRRYADCGVSRIHVVDLDGAKASSPANLKILEAMAMLDGPQIEWGGGIKSEAALRSVFSAGATYAIIGSLAAKHPETFCSWLRTFSHEKMVLGADVRDNKVSVNGWLEDLPLDIDTLVDGFLAEGLSQVICTDISRDGMLKGPNTELYVRLQKKYDHTDFTVSGGISSMDDILRLEEAGLRKVIIGKAIYEGRITLKDIERHILRS